MPLHATLYDADGADREVVLSKEIVAQVGDKRLLWVDLYAFDDKEVESVAAAFDLPQPAVIHLLQDVRRPRVDNYGSFYLITIETIQSSDYPIKTAEVDFIVGADVVITAHRGPIDVLENFNQQVKGDSKIGQLDAPAFLTALLDWHLTNYFRVLERLAEEVDALDERALHPKHDHDLLGELAQVRRRVARIRKALTPHREVFAALMRPDFQVFSDRDPTHSSLLHDRLERAIEAVENVRELLLGSFDIYTTQVAQRTNEIMKLLTLVTVVLLPISAIAGVLGMNFRARIFDTGDLGYWIVVIVMVLIALLTLVVARRQRWI